MGRWGLNSALTTRLPSLVSSALSVSTQAIQLPPPTPSQSGAPFPALVRPPRPLLPRPPGQALAARPGRGGGGPSHPPAPRARHGPLLPPPHPPPPLAVTSPAPGPLPWRGRLPGSSGGAGRPEALPHASKRAGAAGRQEGRTDGRSADGRRGEEPQRRGRARLLGGAWRLRPWPPPRPRPRREEGGGRA